MNDESTQPSMRSIAALRFLRFRLARHMVPPWTIVMTVGLSRHYCQRVSTELTREQGLLQAGILAYTEEFSHRYNDHEQDFEVLARQAAKGLRRLICRPSHQEAAAFKDLRHSIDWGSQAFRPLVATELSLASILSPGRLLASLRHCCWPEGSLRYSGIPGGLLLMSGLRRALRSRQNLRKLARFCANLFRGRPSSTTMATPVVLEETEIAGATEKGKA